MNFAKGTSALLLTLACLVAVSCSKIDTAASNAEKKTYNSTGMVKAVDLKNNKVTIDHQDIPGFMSAMEMTFSVASAPLLDGIAVGDQVAFSLERSGGKATVTAITRIAGTAPVDGAAVFSANCAECHGPKGEGTKKGIPLITGHALAHSEEEYVQQVVNGKPNKMTAFRDNLSDEQIAAVIKYVRTVIQADVKSEQRLEHKH
jgi:mono/diheme cytochrome c family protein